MRHGSLFSGIGGFDLAAEWMGWENMFHCEWNPFGQRVLKHYWPNAKSYADITQTDFNIWRGRIDILTGGFPCQPYSVAGKRKGKDDNRHLWPEMLRAIREIQPVFVVGENVPGLINWNGGLVFNEVQTDLENEGYEVIPVILPAAGVNAPHKRERIWFVAYSNRSGHGRWSGSSSDDGKRKICTGIKNNGQKVWGETNVRSSITSNSNDNGSHGSENRQSDTKGNGSDAAGKKTTKQSARRSGKTVATNSNINFRSEGRLHTKGSETSKRYVSARDACSIRDWKNFPTQSPVCNGNDGLPTGLDGITISKWRNESIKGGGNAIVPQVALQIFKAIEATIAA